MDASPDVEDQEDIDALSIKSIKHVLGKVFGSKTKSPSTTTSSSTDSDIYDFSYPRRGVAVIINNKNFLDSHQNRNSSTLDVINLTKMFTCYNFDIIIYNDLTKDEIIATLQKVAGFSDHERADCFACAICSHGSESTLPGERTSHDAIIGVRGGRVLTKDLVEIFTDDKCPGLQRKPRLFFIQACRGDLLDDGQDIQVAGLSLTPKDSYTDDKNPEKGGNSSSPCAPIYPHFLVMYASPPGHAAWRRDDGTWFIKCLADTFLKTSLERTSLTKVLTLVSGKVARLESNTGKKQVPCILSTLTKDIYLKAKKIR